MVDSQKLCTDSLRLSAIDRGVPNHDGSKTAQRVRSSQHGQQGWFSASKKDAAAPKANLERFMAEAVASRSRG